MTIALAKDVEEFLHDQVCAGVSTNAGELANDIIRSVREQQKMPFEITPELEDWLLEAAEKPVTSLTDADFDAIRDRVQARTKRKAS
jgi:Arc/MetJ-type ribon-helix-helix transcriptional regulator